jgi:type VI protein secretion system component VasA
VLDKFLASYAGINAYTRFELEDKTTGSLFKWPIRQGLKLLL